MIKKFSENNDIRWITIQEQITKETNDFDEEYHEDKYNKNNYDNFPNENTPNENDITKDTETIIQTLNTIINVVYWIQNINKLIKILFICIIKWRILQNW